MPMILGTLPEHQTVTPADGSDQETTERLQTGIKPGKVEDRLLPPQPEAPSAVQGLLSEVRLLGFHLQATDGQRAWQVQDGLYARHQPKEHSPDNGRTAKARNPPLGAFPFEPDSGTVKVQDTGVAQLLCKVSEVRTAETVSGCQFAISKMGTQQVSEVQAEALVSSLQVFAGDSQKLPQYV